MSIMEVEKRTLSEEKNIEEIEVTVPSAIYESVRDKVYRDLQGRVRLSGFRPGKIPRQMIDTMVGKENIDAAIFEDIATDIASDLIEEYGRKNLVTVPEFVEGKEPKLIGSDATVRFKIHKLPKVSKKFERYEDIEFTVKMDPEEDFLKRNVERLIERFRRLSAILTPVVNEGAKEGNAVRTVMRVYDVHKKRRRDVEEKYKDRFIEVEDSEYMDLVDIDLHQDELDVRIYDALIGVKKGDRVTAVLEDELGEEVTFVFDVKEVYEVELPELTDDLVKENSNEYETVKDLKDEYLDRSREAYDLITDFFKRETIRDDIVNYFDVDMSEESIQLLLKKYRKDENEKPWKRKRSDEEVKDVYRRLLAREAVYKFIAEENGLEPKEEDIEKELSSLAERNGITLARAKLYYKTGTSPFSGVDREIRDRNVEDFLMEKCKIDIVEKASVEEEEHEDATSTNSN